MSRTLDAIRGYARTQPDAVALEAGTGAELRSVTYAELVQLIDAQAARFEPATVLGLLADNSIDWVVADLAALQAGVVVVPIPAYFSEVQLQHTILAAGINLILMDTLGAAALQSAAFFNATINATDNVVGSLRAYRVMPDSEHPSQPYPIPPGTQKITFTSGTTDAPKGVCLSLDAIEQVALSLLSVIPAELTTTTHARHLCVLPLATLLENIAGVYLPLLAGATCLLPPLAQVGLNGSSGFNVVTQLSAITTLRATSAILVPQMLTAQVIALSAGMPCPTTLRYLAVGGGSVSPDLLRKAIGLGLPVVEGYGLSECASVVALNQVNSNRSGSVGRPLPHLQVTIADDGEIIVHGTHFAGYLGGISPASSIGLKTGDIGFLDEDGFLFITGRKKSMFITAFGRNVAPEWIERELLAQAGILQAAVFGEARASSIALIVPHPSASHAAIEAAIAAANAVLPDYAKVGEWRCARTPFTHDNGLLTHNGRLRRLVIYRAYADELEPPHTKEFNAIL